MAIRHDKAPGESGTKRLASPSENPLALKLTKEQREELIKYLDEEFTLANSSAADQQRKWATCMRMYHGATEAIQNKKLPIEGLKNIEVVIGAIAADSIYSQALDMTYAVSPLLTVSPARRGKDTLADDAKVLQDLADQLVTVSEFATAHDHALLDDVQLGTGLFYVPWIEETRKTRLGGNGPKLTTSRPIIYPVPPEDFKIPGGKGARTSNLQTVPWFAHRMYYSKHELNELERTKGWTIPTTLTPTNPDLVSFRRMKLGKVNDTTKTKSTENPEQVYGIWATYLYYDIDHDGFREDLLVHYDADRREILFAGWNKYDMRPYPQPMIYQRQAHLFWGMGVLEMLESLEEEITLIHNERNTNMLLANTRIYTGTADAFSGGDTIAVWPGRFFPSLHPEGIKALQVSDVYPSSAQAEAISMSLAERRVGVNDMSTPRPSQVLGSRTPGITAISMLQAVNRRFTPAFNSMRAASADAIRHCLYRIRERLLTSDRNVEAWLGEMLGQENAGRAIEILKRPEFPRQFSIELTASSANANRDVERQNMIMLVNLLSTYYQKALELTMIAANPQTPPPVVETAQKIAAAATELIERTLRTFDSVADPERFLVDMEETVDRLQVSQEGLAGLSGLMAQLQGGGAPAAGGMLPSTPPQGPV